MANKTVEEIVAKAKSGDMSAFDLLYREYSEKLLKYVVKLGIDRNDAEDIVSDSFMEAIEHIGDLKNNTFFSTWLHSIAKNKVSTMKQKEKRYARVDYSTGDGDEQNDGLDLAMAEAAEYRGDTIMLPEDYAANEEIKQILADTINSLNPDQREAVFLYYYKDCTVGEIAKQTGVNENTVKSRLSLARKYMERKLKDLQKSGVVLCAVPISSIIGQLDSEAKIVAAPAPVYVSAASGKLAAAAVAVVVAGTTAGLGYFIHDNNSKLKTDEIKGDVRLVDSLSDDSSSLSETRIVTTVSSDESLPMTEDDSSVVTTAPQATTTEASATANTQGSGEYVPAAQVDNPNGDNGNSQGSSTTANTSETETESDSSAINTTNNDETVNNSDDVIFAYTDTDEGLSIYGLFLNVFGEENPTEIKDLVIPSTIDGKTVTEIYFTMWGEYSTIKSIYIPASVSSLGEDHDVYNLSGPFQNLESIYVDSNNKYYSSYDGVLYNNAKTELLSCPCAKTSIDIPNSVTSINDFSIWECQSLEYVFVPSNVLNIGYQAFYNCTNLKEVVLEDGVEKIGTYAFKECDELNNITIPSSVTEIKKNAFEGCSKLTIKCKKNSYAETFAQNRRINYELLD